MCIRYREENEIGEGVALREIESERGETEGERKPEVFFVVPDN